MNEKIIFTRDDANVKKLFHLKDNIFYFMLHEI